MRVGFVEMKATRQLKIPEFKRLNLLLIGGLIWVLFGSLLIYLGYTKMLSSNQSILVYFLIAVGVFYLTFVYIFKELAYKYSHRLIDKVDETIAVWKVFNIEGYLVIALLIVAGFFVSASERMNPLWWAPEAIGLGLALVVSGVLYWIGYVREKFKIKRG